MFDVVITRENVSLSFVGLSKDIVDELLVSLVHDGCDTEFHISYSEDR